MYLQIQVYLNYLTWKKKIESITGDIRNLETLEKAFNEAKPEIVFHLAAQPLVIESYKTQYILTKQT